MNHIKTETTRETITLKCVCGQFLRLGMTAPNIKQQIADFNNRHKKCAKLREK